MQRLRLTVSGSVITKRCKQFKIGIPFQSEPHVTLVNQKLVAGNEQSMRCCVGIIDVKYASLISKYDCLCKDAQGK